MSFGKLKIYSQVFIQDIFECLQQDIAIVKFIF